MPQTHTKEGNRPNRDLKVLFSHNARANLELRAIRVSEVERALRQGTVTRTDNKTGRLIYTLDDRMGSIRVVAEKEGNSITVITAMRLEEFSDHAG